MKKLHSQSVGRDRHPSSSSEAEIPETEDGSAELHRRPIGARGHGWAREFSSVLARQAITPNQISVLSILFAAAGAAMLVWIPTPAGLLACASCVQLRLLCNLLDGMVAIEGGRQTAWGVLYNEFPDRVADSLLLVGLGTAAGQSWLGWLCALLAALTAYVRMTGASLGTGQDFRGPMAKPHRMAVVTMACLAAAVLEFLHYDAARQVLGAASWVIAVGSFLTCVARTFALARLLKGN